jgi:hypothetical protein
VITLEHVTQVQEGGGVDPAGGHGEQDDQQVPGA